MGHELEVATELKKQNVYTLGLAYSEVLRFNIEAKFEGICRPYNETSFFELLYKFVNIALHHKGVAPTTMKTELELAIGQVFRGKDFNLEAQGYVPGKTPGLWDYQGLACKKSHKLRNVNHAIQARSPAVLSVYPDAKTQLALITGKVRSGKKREQRKVRIPQDAGTWLEQQTQGASMELSVAPDLDKGIVDFMNDGGRPLHLDQMHEQHPAVRERYRPASPIQSQPATARVYTRPQTAITRANTKKEPGRPKTAVVRATPKKKAKSVVQRPFSARPAATRKGGKYAVPRWDKTATSKPKPWAKHEMWDVKMSWL